MKIHTNKFHIFWPLQWEDIEDKSFFSKLNPKKEINEDDHIWVTMVTVTLNVNYPT